MKQKSNKLSNNFNRTIAAALAVSLSTASFAFAADTHIEPVSVSTAAVSSAAPALVSTAAVAGVEHSFAKASEDKPVSVSTAAVPSEQASDSRQIYDAITDLNYKIEYLKSSYNKINADLESLRLAVRDQNNAFNNRISALPVPDTSRVDKLETETVSLRSEISKMRADIDEIQEKLASSEQSGGKRK